MLWDELEQAGLGGSLLRDVAREAGLDARVPGTLIGCLKAMARRYGVPEESVYTRDPVTQRFTLRLPVDGVVSPQPSIFAVHGR